LQLFPGPDRVIQYVGKPRFKIGWDGGAELLRLFWCRIFYLIGVVKTAKIVPFVS